MDENILANPEAQARLLSDKEIDEIYNDVYNETFRMKARKIEQLVLDKLELDNIKEMT